MKWIAVLFLLFPSVLLAGPFGLEMGSESDDVGYVSERGFHHYEISNPPNPHPDLDKYYGTIPPKNGLCYIFAISEAFSDNDKVSKVFKSILSQLSSKYGKATGYSEDGPTFKWKLINSRTNISNLNLAYEYSNSGNYIFVSLRYYFKNYDACQKELEDLKKQSL